MKRLIIIVLSVVAISAVVAGGLIADHTHEEGLGHSGGTDSSGCHTNSKTGDYHCHNPK